MATFKHLRQIIIALCLATSPLRADPLIIGQIYPNATTAAVSISTSSPAIVSWPRHPFAANDRVVFNTSGSLPSGVNAGTPYFVISAGLTADSFQISETQGGAPIGTACPAGTFSQIFTASGAFVVPPCWNNSNFLIEAIGNSGNATNNLIGGGAGAYTFANQNNFSIVIGNSYAIVVAAGSDTSFGGTLVVAKSGIGPTGGSATASIPSANAFKGGDGKGSNGSALGGGGGAAGPHGAGADGIAGGASGPSTPGGNGGSADGGNVAGAIGLAGPNINGPQGNQSNLWGTGLGPASGSAGGSGGSLGGHGGACKTFGGGPGGGPNNALGCLGAVRITFVN